MLRTMVLAALMAVSLALSAPYAEIADIADSSMKTDVSKTADATIIIPNEYFSPTNHTAHPGDELHLCTDIDMKLSALKRSHMGGGTYCCDICDVAFTPSHDPLVVPATGDATKEERLARLQGNPCDRNRQHRPDRARRIEVWTGAEYHKPHRVLARVANGESRGPQGSGAAGIPAKRPQVGRRGSA